jgi:hypothetical protein
MSTKLILLLYCAIQNGCNTFPHFLRRLHNDLMQGTGVYWSTDTLSISLFPTNNTGASFLLTQVSLLQLQHLLVYPLCCGEWYHRCLFFCYVDLKTVQVMNSMAYLWVASITTMFSIVFIFLFSFYTLLHVSALMVHLQVEYTVTYGSYYTYNRSIFRLYNLYIYYI